MLLACASMSFQRFELATHPKKIMYFHLIKNFKIKKNTIYRSKTFYHIYAFLILYIVYFVNLFRSQSNGKTEEISPVYSGSDGQFSLYKISYWGKLVVFKPCNFNLVLFFFFYIIMLHHYVTFISLWDWLRLFLNCIFCFALRKSIFASLPFSKKWSFWCHKTVYPHKHFLLLKIVLKLSWAKLLPLIFYFCV